jgi:hypothetical protein
MTDLTETGLPIFHYENLTRFPEENFRNLCSILNIPFEDRILHSHQYFSEGLGHGKNDLTQPISRNPNYKAQQLSVSARSKILALTYTTWKQIGYQEKDGLLFPIRQSDPFKLQ